MEFQHNPPQSVEPLEFQLVCSSMPIVGIHRFAARWSSRTTTAFPTHDVFQHVPAVDGFAVEFRQVNCGSIAPACLQALQKCGSCALIDLQRLHACGRVARPEVGSRMSISIFNRLAKVLLLTQYDVSMHRTLTTRSKQEHSVLLQARQPCRVRRHVRGLPTRSPGISWISNLLRSWCMTGGTARPDFK